MLLQGTGLYWQQKKCKVQLKEQGLSITHLQALSQHRHYTVIKNIACLLQCDQYQSSALC